MITVSVFGGDMEWLPWWENFRQHYEDRNYDMDNDDDISKALSEWSAINEAKSAFFSFENEADYTLFMLRWG